MSNNAHDLSNRLLNALDNNYNVVDMHTVNEIISILEKINITKELLETTRLGKHVNELRRKTTDPTLARRAKVLVKRWRDLVIPTKASPAHTGSNRSSAERQVRRLGGTPLTSPALSRHVLSPAVNSPRPPSRPAWGGYESDSQDVILVDDDPPPAPLPPAPAPAHLTPPAKRALSPAHTHDDKKAKRDKKPKKRRGHSRAGSGTEAVALAPPPAAAPSLGLGAGAQTPAGAPAAAWGARNGTHERRRNGCRRDAVDPYAALVNKIPAAGAKKVKTTKELLEQIQSRGSKPAEPAPDDQDDDVVLVDDECPIKVDSPVVNGGGAARSPSPPAAPPPPPLPPLEDERRHYECTCGEERAEEACPAARAPRVLPAHVAALHHALLPGVNGTRAPPLPHQFAVRRPARDDRPDLFASVVPLYKYSDYADDYCVKNMSRVPLCDRLPWTEFAPPPPSPPAPPSPPPLRPYPTDPPPDVKAEPPEPPDEGASPRPEPEAERAERRRSPAPKIEPEMVSLPTLEPSERLKAPLLSPEEATQFGAAERPAAAAKEPAADEFAEEQRDHRTVERTKVQLDGRALHEQCLRALRAAPYSYADADPAPVLTLPQEPAPGEAEAALRAALEGAASERTVDELGRPPRPAGFAEWHECARLGELVALPYVVID